MRADVEMPSEMLNEDKFGKVLEILNRAVELRAFPERCWGWGMRSRSQFCRWGG